MSELMDNTSTASDACQGFLALYLPLHPVRSRGIAWLASIVTPNFFDY